LISSPVQEIYQGQDHCSVFTLYFKESSKAHGCSQKIFDVRNFEIFRGCGIFFSKNPSKLNEFSNEEGFLIPPDYALSRLPSNLRMRCSTRFQPKMPSLMGKKLKNHHIKAIKEEHRIWAHSFDVHHLGGRVGLCFF